MGWEKFAISGETYARALSNAGQRAGRSFGPDAFSHIAAQPRAVLKPGLSSFVREQGVLPHTSQIGAMRDLAGKMDWAGDDHLGHPNAEQHLGKLLAERGLIHDTPAGMPNVHERITKGLGTPGDFMDAQEGLPPKPGTSAGGPKARRMQAQGTPPAPIPVRGEPTAVLPTPGPAAGPRRFPRPSFQGGKIGSFQTGLEKLFKR